MTATAGSLGAAVADAGRGRRLVERNARIMWRKPFVIITGLFEPLFYLLSIGIGLGHLVGHLPGPHGTVAYAVYVAPGLLASSAMNGGVNEATFNVFFKLKLAKTYDAVLATPLEPTSVAAGEITWAVLRGTLYAVTFLAFAAALGDITSWWAVVALPGAMLVGFAFAAAGMACTTYMRSWTDFDLVQLAVLPMFLFSTSFYPLSTYPRWLQIVVECTPLYHGVVLLRSLCLGAPSWGLLGHAAYLAAMGALGLAVAGTRVRTLLLS